MITPLKDETGEVLRGRTREEVKDMFNSLMSEAYEHHRQLVTTNNLSANYMQYIHILCAYTVAVLGDVMETNAMWLCEELMERSEYKKKGSKYFQTVNGLRGTRRLTHTAVSCIVPQCDNVWKEIVEDYEDEIYKYLKTLPKMFANKYRKYKTPDPELHAQIDLLKIIYGSYTGAVATYYAIMRIIQHMRGTLFMCFDRGASKGDYNLINNNRHLKSKFMVPYSKPQNNTLSGNLKLYCGDILYYLEQTEECIGLPPRIEKDDGINKAIERFANMCATLDVVDKVLTKVHKRHEGKVPAWFPIFVPKEEEKNETTDNQDAD